MYYPQKPLQSHHKEILMSTTEELRNISTPCISVCKYNSNNYCIGCKRHMNEIFDWLDYNEDMRIAIMKDLIDREIV
jgi:predicted Fe-S protein YdhL (DUF1289 family)|tara:strand:- start:24 stop:254 length:231 start_codon:yes stop_codon:yes gene_type:complete